jgi:hypothetical protein
MVYVPEYPKAALCDVKRGSYPAAGNTRGIGFYTKKMEKTLVTIKELTIYDKMDFWRWVMEYAKSRCIQVYLFTWNIYLYGLENSGYNIAETVSDVYTMEYLRSSVCALVKEYPLLAGIGVTAGENMCSDWTEEQDVRWIRDTYGAGIERALQDYPQRKLSLIIRTHMTNQKKIEEAFSDSNILLEYSFKYSMARMAVNEKPVFGNQFFNSLSIKQKTWLTIRNDDFYMFPWADPVFITKYMSEMPREKLAGYYYGADGLIWAKDYQSRNAKLQGRYYFDKHWLSFRLMGLIGYHGTVSPMQIAGFIGQRYPAQKSDILLNAWQNISKALPLFQRVYWYPYDFQWYYEACVGLDDVEKQLVFHDLNHLIKGEACPGSGYLSVSETADQILNDEIVQDHDAISIATKMSALCVRAQELLNEVNVPQDDSEAELIADLIRGSELGLYYAHKLKAAVWLQVYRKSGDLSAHEISKNEALLAYAKYLSYSSKSAVYYKPQLLSRLRGYVSPDQFDVRAWVDVLIAQDKTKKGGREHEGI